MIPKTRCSQRRAIISLARAVSRKAKCGCHSGKVSKWRYGSIGRPRNKARMPCGNTVADFAAKGQPDIGRDRIQSTGEFGARERTRTSTTLRSLAPEASASASSATRARVKKKLALMSQPDLRGIFNSARGLLLCQRKARPTAGGEVRIAERAPANVGTRRLSLHQLL